jgi:hypothetical protein
MLSNVTISHILQGEIRPLIKGWIDTGSSHGTNFGTRGTQIDKGVD